MVLVSGHNAINQLVSSLLLIFLLLILFPIYPVSAVETASTVTPQQSAEFGGPDAVENQIADDAEIKNAAIKQRYSQAWFDWKKQLQDRQGISLGFDYTGLYLIASENGLSGQDRASGGIARFFGSWDLTGRSSGNTGALVWKLEHRHKYSRTAPSDLGFELGYAGLFEPPFSEQGGRWTNLYWRQRLNNNKVTLVGGFLDVTDYVDVFALGSPWTGFMNFAFSTGTTTIYTPNDATLGVAGAAMLTENIYVIGGLANAYSDPKHPFNGIETFFNDGEYFSHLELGITPAQDRIYLDNTHITMWHVDESQAAGIQSGWGAAFSYVGYFNEKFMPFARAGYARDGGSLMQKSVSVGLGLHNILNSDLLGFGFNWGEPNDSTFGPGLNDQYALELFYRIQLLEQLVLTPDIQYIKDPALNPDQNNNWVFGLRTRLAL